MQSNETLPAWFKTATHKDSNKHAVIIGGGIAGSQIAWHLAERDWKVTLIERHAQLASEASGNKAGVISPKMTAKPSLGEDFYQQCFLYASQQLQKLEQQGYDFTWDTCGVLQLNHNEREYKRWQSLKQRNFPSRFLQCIDADAVSQVAGIPLDVGASYFPQGAWIDPSSLCRALCTHKNIQVMLHTNAISLQRENQRWVLKDSSQHTIITSNTLVLANGKDIQQFKQTKYLPFMPVLGQTSEAVASYSSTQLKTVIGHEGYFTPQIKGQHIFGATFERNISEAKPRESADKHNLTQLNKYLPKLAKQLTEVKSSHAAIRMTTPDRFPYVGAMPDRQYYQQHYHDLSKGKYWKQYPDAQYENGLFIFAGHASRGLTTTGLTANYLASVICNENFTPFTAAIKTALHPARYDIRRSVRHG